MYRDDVRRALASRAAERAQARFLKEASSRHDVLCGLPTADEVVAKLRDRRVAPGAKDGILAAFVAEYQRGHGVALEILSRAMFPVLDRAYQARARGRSREHLDEIWSAVYAAFGEAARRYPLARRPARVAANLRGETLRVLAIDRKRERALGRGDLALAHEIAGRADIWIPEAPRHATEAEPADSGADELSRAEIAARLDAAVASGMISTRDRRLLVGVEIEKRSLRELALELGISREAAKKRRSRARRRLQAHRASTPAPRCPHPPVDPDEPALAPSAGPRSQP